MPNDYGPSTESRIAEVIAACRRYGKTSIIALSGVPGTGKSFIASIAAQRLATDPLLVKEIQFHPTFSYEEFVEGYRANNSGGFSVEKGVFLDLNDIALDDPTRNYVLLIEELTRANLPAVLGEVMTFLEHRERSFRAIYSGRPVRIAAGLTFLATFNPLDRSALELDAAVIRRLRIIHFPPDVGQLSEMLAQRELSAGALSALKSIFVKCEQKFGDDYHDLMPFGHGIFSEVSKETPDLHELWVQRIKPLLYPPARRPHPFADFIAENYPWRRGPQIVVAAAVADAPAAQPEMNPQA